jgi:hypothetical protein
MLAHYRQAQVFEEDLQLFACWTVIVLAITGTSRAVYLQRAAVFRIANI